MSKTLHSILADVNNGIVRMVSILPTIFNHQNLFSKFLRTVPRLQLRLVSPSLFQGQGICPVSCQRSLLLCGLWSTWWQVNSNQFWSFVWIGWSIFHREPYGVHFIRVFHTSFNCWFLTGFWVTASLLSSSGLLSDFLLILALLWSEWFQFFLWSVLSVSFQGLWWPNYNW